MNWFREQSATTPILIKLTTYVGEITVPPLSEVDTPVVLRSTGLYQSALVLDYFHDKREPVFIVTSAVP